MRVLLTNDDGIESPGLTLLADALSRRHDVFIVAPDRDRSGFSQAITVGRTIGARRVAAGRWATDGTPADCVRVAILGGLVPRPEAVVSGINLGANLGTDLFYSGTAGAARQAAMMGVPAIAASAFNYDSAEDARPCAEFVFGALEAFVEILSAGESSFINVNVPPCPNGRVRIVRPGRLSYASTFSESVDQAGIRRFSSVSSLQPLSPTDSEDRAAVESGAVSLSVMGLWRADPEAEDRLRSAFDYIQTETFVNRIHT